MPIKLSNCFAVEIEITIMAGSNGVHPSLMFHPENPFLRRRSFRPLPFLSGFDKSQNGTHHKVQLYTVIEEKFTVDPINFNLEKAFNCFNNVSSVGAKYSIRLCVDVPDNNNPLDLPPNTGSETGHSFVVVTKSNGSKSVTQVFGFYAQNHPGYLTPFRSMPSVIKNNQLREINAAIEMNLTEQQFLSIRQSALDLAKRKYAAVDYNCTNFGLDLFNSVRSNKITVESYTLYLPHSNAYVPTAPNRISIAKTPQKLFKKLKEMKEGKDPEASNIVIDQSNKTIAPLTHGECD